MKKTLLFVVTFTIMLTGCASGPPPIYTNFDTKTKPSISATVIGRSVSQGPELVVLLNIKTNQITSAIRGISLNREQVFVLSLEPGTYAVHRLGIHGAPIGAKDESFKFTLVSGETVYIGTFVNDWHPPQPNQVSGRIIEQRMFGSTVCSKLLCTGYLDGTVRSPYARVGLVDESASLLPKLRQEMPLLNSLKIDTRLAN